MLAIVYGFGSEKKIGENYVQKNLQFEPFVSHKKCVTEKKT